MDHVKDLLSPYLDKSLPEPHASRVQSHLADCAACRQELQDLRSVCHMVSSLPAAPLPAGFHQRLERRRRGTARSRPSAYFLPFPARVAAFALSSLIVMVVVYQKVQVMFPIIAASGSQELASGSAELRLEGSAPQPAAAQARPRARASGEPVDAAPAALKKAAVAGKTEVSNEALQRGIEAEKGRLGLRILPRRQGAPSLDSISPFAAAPGAEAQKLAGAPAPALVSGPTPSLLTQRISGAAAGAPAAPRAGYLLRSEAERAQLWSRQGWTGAAPEVDYSREILVVVAAPDSGSAVEIASVEPAPDHVLVRYRLVPLPPQAPAAGTPSYQMRVVPLTDLPILFEKLP